MTFALLDGNNLAIAAHATSGGMCTSNGIPTGMLFNFLRSVKKLKTDHKLENISVAWDSKGSWRREFYPGYKQARRDKVAQQDLLSGGNSIFIERDILKLALEECLNITQMHQDRYEADDLAGYFSRMACATQNPELILVSNDKDWWQCVNHKTSVFMPMKGSMLSYDIFDTATGCDNTQMFIAMKAIMGDDGDSVPGVAGVGEITAIKYLKHELKTSATAYAKIEAWMNDPDGYARSHKLVDLISIPDEEFTNIELVEGKFDADRFRDLCTDMEFDSILKKFDEWCTALAG